ncbi:MAG: hypothetical protein ACRDT8_25635, partial [Micromonosporaceae bacterium]
VGDAVARLLHDNMVTTPVRTFGIPQRFLDHGKRNDILADIGLTASALEREIEQSLTHYAGAVSADHTELSAPAEGRIASVT